MYNTQRFTIFLILVCVLFSRNTFAQSNPVLPGASLVLELEAEPEADASRWPLDAKVFGDILGAIHKDIRVQIPRAYFDGMARWAEEHARTANKKELAAAYKTVATDGTGALATVDAKLRKLDWGTTLAGNRARKTRWQQVVLDLSALTEDSRSSVLTGDRTSDVSRLHIRLKKSLKSGYTIRGGPASGVPATLIGLNAEVRIVAGDSILASKAFLSEWPDKPATVGEPFDKTLKALVEYLSSIKPVADTPTEKRR